jgi:diacylglycerol kinase (ATP)
MRAAAILGLGRSEENLKPFQTPKNEPKSGAENIEWRLGLPASSDDADVILLFGGDGTIHRHLAALVQLGLPVLIVPAGSGNDFARALGLGRVRDSLAAWERFSNGTGQMRRIDLGVILPRETRAKHYFCCVAGVGLDGEVTRRANRLPRWLRGHGGYAISLLPTIFSFAPVRVKISAPSAEAPEMWMVRSDQPTLLAAFANTPVYGGGMKIAPQAKMDDGLLDVCVVGDVGRLKLFSMFPTVYAGRHLQIREVSYFQAPRLQVETERGLGIYADGEYVCTAPAEIAVEPEALSVIVP